MTLSRRILWMLPIAFAWSSAVAQPGSVETALKPIIDKLARTASSQQFRQIIGAARASPQLARQLGRLVAEGKLTEIRIVAAKGNKPFRAWVAGTVMYFTSDFLQSLTEYRGPNFHAGNIVPDNMVYCLGHLAYHLAMGEPDHARYKRREEYVQKMLEIEAGAYIQGYNDVVDAATQQNDGKPLSQRQMMPILTNPMYGDALGKARFSANGNTIDLNAQNIALIVEALRNLQVADVE